LTLAIDARIMKLLFILLFLSLLPSRTPPREKRNGHDPAKQRKARDLHDIFDFRAERPHGMLKRTSNQPEA